MLENINSPEDLKKLQISELDKLAHEVRQKIISTVSKTGGHLAPSLGTVELTIALHYMLNLPKDVLIWDVGHQAYTHKLLTGRQSRFHTLRQFGGICGFTQREESEYDAFGTGHSSTSISAAVGMAAARDLKKENYDIVAVIGDGALGGGLAFEALNHAGHLKKNFIVILNDNEMSISKNVGAMSLYLSKIITGNFYNKAKKDARQFLSRFPQHLVDKMTRVVKLFEEAVIGLISPGVIFEELGFRYVGPIDGHNIPLLIETLNNSKKLKGPTLIHTVTKKGKGFAPAEESPNIYHGLGSFDIVNGKVNVSNKGKSYSDLFGEKLADIAKNNPGVVAVTAAMGEGTGLKSFSQIFPDRFFDVGMAEEHAVTFAAGLAAQGMKPVVTIYSTFLQRAYDQILHDVCIQNLPVVFAIDRAGVVGEDGRTHHGVFDISYLRHLPNIVIFSPADGKELQEMLELCIKHNGPAAIRYPRGEAVDIDIKSSKVKIGRAECLKKGDDAVIFAVGSMVRPSLEAALILEKNKINASVVNIRSIKPVDEELIVKMCKKINHVITVEDHILQGGFGSLILEVLSKHNISGVKIHRMGIPDEFVEHGKREILLDKYKLNAKGIAKTIKTFLAQ